MREGYTIFMADFRPDEKSSDVPFPEVKGLTDGSPYLQVRPKSFVPSDNIFELDVIQQANDERIAISGRSGKATVCFLDGPLDPLSFLGPAEGRRSWPRAST
jgi:hypothetical protein